MIVPAEGPPEGTVGGGALEKHAVETAASLSNEGTPLVADYNLEELGMTCGGRVTLCYEYLTGNRYFVLCGGGHVSSALAPILETMGFSVAVVDDRDEVCGVHREAGRTVVPAGYEDISGAVPYLRNGFAFIATQGHLFDTVVLQQVLEMKIPFTYVGMIGSKRKITTAFDSMAKKGLEIPPWVYAPVGLRIGGGSPGEIAVSVASEVLSVMYGQDAPHMRSEA
jgi:xanthine dehydrogenase accessory factor